MALLQHWLQVLDKSGRTVKLSWQAPYNGNSNLTRYVIEFKPTKGTWKNDIDHVLVPGDQVWVESLCIIFTCFFGGGSGGFNDSLCLSSTSSLHFYDYSFFVSTIF
jgi:hypothetical protein